MTKNATIRSRLIDLLNVMDARTMINIFVDTPERPTSVKFLKVYEFLAEPELMRKYENYEVIGLSCGLTTNILIREEA